MTGEARVVSVPPIVVKSSVRVTLVSGVVLVLVRVTVSVDLPPDPTLVGKNALLIVKLLTVNVAVFALGGF